MPELPEAERIRLSLSKRVIGMRVTGVRVRRRDVIEGDASPEALLAGQAIVRVDRHGKQLALVGDAGACVRIRLGMTGRLTLAQTPLHGPPSKHAHVLWRLTPALPRSRRVNGQAPFPIADSPADKRLLIFEDARRFGGAHTHADRDSLARAWSSLGPDALTISTRDLAPRLIASRRAIKAALLDQSVLAGVGNIYADEALHRAGLAPARPANSLRRTEVRAMSAAIRATLRQAVRAGGSTIRDYADSDAAPGAYQRQHKVYARGGLPCLRCGTRLAQGVAAQRTTVWCPRCQH